MAESSSWRRRAPIWLRILLGLLLFPVIWVGLALLLGAVLPTIWSSTTTEALLFAEAIAAAFVSWLVVRRASTRVSVGLTAFALLVCVLLALAAVPTYQGYKPQPPVAGGRGPGVGESPDSAKKVQLPEFPWPPPAASASYVLPDAMLAGYQTVGEAFAAILSALERSGYVERSFFRTQDGGVALVTRLERINDDGSPSAEAVRWPATAQAHGSTRSLFDFLRGLFYVDPGHYRVIVFILQDLPFSQSSETITAAEAKAWLGREDTAAAAGRVYDRLSQILKKPNVFFDVSVIGGGEDFVARIESEIAKSDVALIFIGDKWLGARPSEEARIWEQEDHVRAEVRAALERELLVLPVLVGGRRMPKPEQLPEDIRAIATKNALLLRHESFDDDTENIVSTVLGVAARTRRWEDKGTLAAKLLYALGGALAACTLVLLVALVHNWILARPLSASIGAPLTTLLLIAGVALGAWLGLRYEARKRRLR